MLDTRQGDALWELTEGRRVQKARRRVRVGDAVAEVDEYFGALDGLVVAEVEFDDEEASRAFRPPVVVRARGDRRPALLQPQPGERRDPSDDG